MPALLLRQFYILRDDDKPIGLALWAKCGMPAVKKLEKGMIQPENRLAPDEWNSGEDIWIVDFITPFATHDNKHRELMLVALIEGPLVGKDFNFHQTDTDTGCRVVRRIDRNAVKNFREPDGSKN